jgi:tripartite-type tricarboxylate transporter receptor subunit TctC
MKHALAVAAGLLSAFSLSVAQAAEANYPSRPIRFIVPFAPGGPSDVLSRMAGIKLTDSASSRYECTCGG